MPTPIPVPSPYPYPYPYPSSKATVMPTLAPLPMADPPPPAKTEITWCAWTLLLFSTDALLSGCTGQAMSQGLLGTFTPAAD